ncbi:TOBE domain-containing protein [Echinicola marina]|uniref:TOBE domain-containing protein n=1 Tax=Echinicola marina TaxID=2859768 RepID=UPI001CF709F0|nr:TOBE domain-containing protein [Echinicola marina]UCS92382.1 TOBE domain-containing protein [Echinicola marina]
MNQIEGQISSIQSTEHMSLVGLNMGNGIEFQSILLDTVATANYLQMGKRINVLFKETELVIAKEVNINISLENKISGTITEIEKGEILSRIKLDSVLGDLIALVSTLSCDSLSLEVQDQVLAMIKFNEVILSPI